MLLNEIKRTRIQTLAPNTKRLRPEDHPERFTEIGEGIGAGIMHSKIYLDKKQPNQILKVVPIHDQRDSYYTYVRMIEKHQNNPFFPKIAGIRLYEVEPYEHTSDSGYKSNIKEHLLLYVWMEKLVPLSKLDSEHARQLLSNVGIFYEGDFKDDLTMRSLFDMKFQRQDIAQNSQIPQFNKALRLLEPLFKKFHSDLHAGNMMVRLTGVGPQLVITDPVYPSFGYQ